MIRRSGNFGFVNTGGGELITFNLNARTTGWEPSSRMILGGFGTFQKYRSVHGVRVIPYGPDDDMPGYVDRVLSKFYAGEGIMGKKAGLQWGEGPRLYVPAVDADNKPFRQWVINAHITAQLEATDYINQMHRCLIDLVHLEGFWVKITRTRGSRVGGPGALAKIEHVPARTVRFVYAGEGIKPTEAVVGDFPNPDANNYKRYPLFDPAQPFKHPVSLAYYQIYSYNKDFYSVPRFIGAADWLELAGTLAGILAAYNENASAISMHIESPQSYWDRLEARIREICEKTKVPYESRMLEEAKDMAMEQFAANLSGRKNAGKFMHTSQFWNEIANDFEGWKITPIDKKIKDYIEAQVAICRKAESAATSGFGLDPALTNLILDTKLGSGSEKLYSLKVYNATETAVPDMVLCEPFNIFIKANNPNENVRIGLYRAIVDAEKNVNPENRMKANA